MCMCFTRSLSLYISLCHAHAKSLSVSLADELPLSVSLADERWHAIPNLRIALRIGFWLSGGHDLHSNTHSGNSKSCLKNLPELHPQALRWICTDDRSVDNVITTNFGHPIAQFCLVQFFLKYGWRKGPRTTRFQNFALSWENPQTIHSVNLRGGGGGPNCAVTLIK